jgi:uncharacterized membrane protein YbhN (UPF0104 family)
MRKMSRAAGLIIGLLGVAFVIRTAAQQRTEVLASLRQSDPLWLTLALATGLGGMTVIGIGWWLCLRGLGYRRGVKDTLRDYFVGQLGKYVPGAIWAVVGRAEMARRGGVPALGAYGSTLLSLTLTYFAAILTAALALLTGAAGGGTVAWEPVIGLLLIGILSLHPRVLEMVLEGLRRLSGRTLSVPVPSWRTAIGLLLAHLPAWFAISAATWLVAYAVVGIAPNIGNIVFATTLAWTIGFLALPVPGGIGVREAVFVAAATTLPSAAQAAAVALVARALFVLIDIAGAGITSWIARGSARGARLSH